MEQLYQQLLAKVTEIRATDSQVLKDETCIKSGAQSCFPFDYDSMRKLIDDASPFE